MTTDKRYLWLGLEAGLWPSYLLEHRLANALAEAGRDVTLISCRGVLHTNCPVMSANHITASSVTRSRNHVCNDCRYNSKLTQRSASYSTISIDHFVTDQIRECVNGLMEEVTTSNWSHFVVDNIPVGRYATYVAMLHHKQPDVTSSTAAWMEYLADLRNALLVLKSLPAIFEEQKPSHVVVYNPLYPTHRVFVEYATSRGIPIVSLSAGSFLPARYDTALIFPRIESSQTMVDSPSIARSLDIPCSEIEIRSIASHLEALVRGQDPWVYSSEPVGWSTTRIREELGIRSASPVVTVLVSSPDETRSSLLVGAEYVRDRVNGFSDIAEFIEESVNAARLLPEVDFVFRLHPRLLPNKRDRVHSPDLENIERALVNRPQNAVINTPDQRISLYDAIRISGAALNQSSSAGLEFLALGLPVVQYDAARQNAYPPSFGRCVGRHDAQALAQAIDSALTETWSIEKSRLAFRWYAAIMLRSTLHLRELQNPQLESVGVEHPNDAPVGRRWIQLKSLIPESIREKVSRRLARARRPKELVPDRQSPNWPGEWLARLDALDGLHPIWNPLIIPRDEGRLPAETEYLTSVVNELRHRISYSN